MTNNKTIIYLVVTLVIFSFLYSPGINRSRAEENNIDSVVNGIISSLPAPVTDLLNTGKQIWQNLVGGNITVPNVNIPINLNSDGGSTNIDLKSVFESLNSWFSGVTGGIDFIQIIKAVGSFVVWILSTAAELISRGLSLIK